MAGDYKPVGESFLAAVVAYSGWDSNQKKKADRGALPAGQIIAS
jgi:hypothetical protein